MDKHEVIYNHLLALIENGSLKEGDRLPTEAELCRDFGVSRITSMRAVKDLQRAGLVRRVSGRGTFVCRASLRGLRPFQLIVPGISTRFYIQMIQSFGGFFSGSRRPYGVTLSNYDHAFTGLMFSSVSVSGCSGLAVVPQGLPESDRRLAGELASFPYPVVTVSRTLEGVSCHQIAVDEEAAGAIAAEYLLNQHHRRFLYLGPHSERRTSVLRYAGVVRAMRCAGLGEDALLAMSSIESIDLPRVREIFSGSLQPTAVITADENQAAMMYDILKVLGIRVGRDVAMVSLDGGLIGLSLETPLTAVEFPGAEVGRIAAETLSAIDSGDLESGRHHVRRVLPRLIIRASCGEGGQVYRHEYLREVLKESI